MIIRMMLGLAVALLISSALFASQISQTNRIVVINPPEPGDIATYTFTTPGWATFGLALPEGLVPTYPCPDDMTKKCADIELVKK